VKDFNVEINVLNFQHQKMINNKKRTDVILDSIASRSNLIILKSVLVQRNKPFVFNQVLFCLKKSQRHLVEKVDPVVLVSRSLQNLRPLVTFRFKKVAGVRHRLPFIKTKYATRDQFQAVYWLLDATAKRKGGLTSQNLCDEVLDVLKKRGFAHRSRFLFHRVALTQRPFLKFL
jgi:ribosomal protein S7